MSRASLKLFAVTVALFVASVGAAGIPDGA
jgi:hypothetical protein